MVPHFYRGSTYCHTLPKVWQCCWDEDRNQKPTRVLNIPLVISASRTSWSPLPLLGHKSTSALYETTPRNFTFAWQNRYNFSRKCTLLCTACFKVIFFTGSVSFEKVFKDTQSPKSQSRERPTWWLRRDVRNPGGGCWKTYINYNYGEHTHCTSTLFISVLIFMCWRGESTLNP